MQRLQAVHRKHMTPYRPYHLMHLMAFLILIYACSDFLFRKLYAALIERLPLVFF